MTTIPISEVLPFVQWIQEYHTFRTRLDLVLYQTALNLLELHQKKLGPEVHPGVWEGKSYRVFVQARTITFEVLENSSADEALKAFNTYQKKLFRD